MKIRIIMTDDDLNNLNAAYSRLNYLYKGMQISKFGQDTDGKFKIICETFPPRELDIVETMLSMGVLDIRVLDITMGDSSEYAELIYQTEN